MSKLLNEIEAKEQALQTLIERSEKDKDGIIGHYRDQAYQEIALLKSASEKHKQALVQSMNEELAVLKADIDVQTQQEIAQVEKMFQANKEAAMQLLMEEVLSDGNR